MAVSGEDPARSKSEAVNVLFATAQVKISRRTPRPLRREVLANVARARRQNIRAYGMVNNVTTE